jgi:hypothetical protein
MPGVLPGVGSSRHAARSVLAADQGQVDPAALTRHHLVGPVPFRVAVTDHNPDPVVVGGPQHRRTDGCCFYLGSCPPEQPGGVQPSHVRVKPQSSASAIRRGRDLASVPVVGEGEFQHGTGIPIAAYDQDPVALIQCPPPPSQAAHHHPRAPRISAKELARGTG